MTALAVGGAGAAVVTTAVALLALTTVLRSCSTPLTDRLARAGAVLSAPLLLASITVVVVRFTELSFT